MDVDSARHRRPSSAPLRLTSFGFVLLAFACGVAVGTQPVGAGEPGQTASPRPHRSVCYVPISALDAENPGPGKALAQMPATWLAASPAKLSGMNRSDSAWEKYLKLWHSHHRDRSNPALRGYLGLSVSGDRDPMKSRRGRSRIKHLGWRAGSYSQLDSPHFRVFSQADRESTKQVAQELERCYWVWTQMFFPLWEGAKQVAGQLDGWDDRSVSAQDYLASSGKRLTIQRKLRVVLFRDAEQYVRTLQPSIPGIEQSTGYYDDDRRTTYLFASGATLRAGQGGDASASGVNVLNDQTLLETLRHELVHQLFREATRSTGPRSSSNRPGEQRDFWLVEGVAGYFESMVVADGVATVGGWDSPRLQFARFRTIAGGDWFPLEQLRPDGRLAVQSRTDLPRWYAHAIAQTHRLMDAGQPAPRQWCLAKLAQLYRVDSATIAWKTILDRDGLSRAVPLRSFLEVDDTDLLTDPTVRAIDQLCLAGCNLTPKASEAIGPLPGARWLDLSRTKITNDFVLRLVGNPVSLKQLSLELTLVNDGLADWLLGATSLSELDLSWTRCGDPTLAAISGHPSLTTLWLTGSQLTDQSIEAIATMKSLRRVDLQRTNISDAGIETLRKRRPDLSINPIKLVASPSE